MYNSEDISGLNYEKKRKLANYIDKLGDRENYGLEMAIGYLHNYE